MELSPDKERASIVLTIGLVTSISTTRLQERVYMVACGRNDVLCKFGCSISWAHYLPTTQNICDLTYCEVTRIIGHASNVTGCGGRRKRQASVMRSSRLRTMSRLLLSRSIEQANNRILADGHKAVHSLACPEKTVPAHHWVLSPTSLGNLCRLFQCAFLSSVTD